MKEFIKSDKYGQLYIDRILFESYFPVIFTCVNDTKEIFIGVCCQNNERGCKWLLGKTSGISIVRMLRDEITVRQLLLEYSSGKISVDYFENEYAVAYDNSDWDENSLYLPKADSYMYAEAGEFDEEIDYLLSLDHRVCYDSERYKRIAEAAGTISRGIEPMAEALSVFASALGNILVTGEVVNTLKVFGELCTDLVLNTEKYTAQEKYKPVYSSTFDVLSEDLSIKMEFEDSNYADAA